MAAEIKETPQEISKTWLWIINNWKKAIFTYVIPVFVFLGGVTYFEEIRDEAIDVWNMPKNGVAAIAKSDSMDLVLKNDIEILIKKVRDLEKDNKTLKIVLHNTTIALSQETDPMQYKGIRFNATNPHYSTGLRTYWLFVEDSTRHLLIPHELKYNVQIDGYEYYDRINRKRFKLKPKLGN